MSKIDGIIRYKKQFKNYIPVIFKMVFKGYPIEVIYRNGDSLTVLNSGFLHFASSGLHFNYEKNSDLLTFRYNNIDLYFYGSFYNNDFCDTYGFRTYSHLNVDGKIVIDVGANIGDTAIYFAIKGAKKVIAVEPVPFAFRYLIKNIASNNMSNIIIPMNIGIGKSETEIKIKDEEMDVTGYICS